MSTNQTKIAQELKRIEDAKGVLAEKAEAMELTFTDEGAGEMGAIDENSTIEQIAYAYNDIKVRDADSVVVNGRSILVGGGFYPQDTPKLVDGVTRAQTTIEATLDDESGESIVIDARNNQQGGYVERDASKDYASLIVDMEIEGKVAKAFVVGGSTNITREFPNAQYTQGVTLTAGQGSVSAESPNVFMTKENSQPTSGFYIKVKGSGKVGGEGIVTVQKAGYIEYGSSWTEPEISSEEAEAFYVLPSASIPTTFDPLTQEKIEFERGFTNAGEVTIGGDLLARLKAI